MGFSFGASARSCNQTLEASIYRGERETRLKKTAAHFHPMWDKSLCFPYVGNPNFRRPTTKKSKRQVLLGIVLILILKRTIRKPAGTDDDGDHGLHPRTGRTTAAYPLSCCDVFVPSLQSVGAIVTLIGSWDGILPG